jgi:stage II sporulation protein AB (anti-sigma F factor)
VEKAVLPFYTTLENEERSGMGFTIMQTFMDGFSLSSEKGQGTRVTMFRRIGSKLETENEQNTIIKEGMNA